MHYKVGNKVFKTEKEARDFSKALMEMGALSGWSKTAEPVTHHHLGNGITTPIGGYATA